jgi:hypothetical protein
MKTAALVLLGLLPGAICAQARPSADSALRQRTTEVASKFEEFTGRKGALFTRTYEKIGEIRAENFRDVTVSIATVTDAGPGGQSLSALAFGARYLKDEIPTGVGVIDADEVDSFVNAIALMEKRAPELSTALNATEAIYTAKTGLRLHLEGKGEAQRFYLESPRYGLDPYEFEIHDIPRLRDLIDKAAERLKSGGKL